MKKTNLTNSIILITGGTGSWGKELVKQLLKNEVPKEIRIYSRGEQEQVKMKREYQNKILSFYIGDIRDKNRLLLASKNVDYIFHLAALKHVPVCEENPWEAVKTNIIGTQNVIECSLENNIKKVIYISTDKAVDPLNLYGVTKAASEKLIIAANLKSEITDFVCIRGGNVTGTKGSVIPLFKEQIQRLNEITLTDKKMTRFFMNLNDAIKLVLKAAKDSIGGEILVMKASAVKITDLADIMIKKLGNKNTKINTIGIRPGEKLFEILKSKYEAERTYNMGKYFVILPQIRLEKTFKFYKNKKIPKIKYEEFNSNNAFQLKKKKIETLLKHEGWLKNNMQADALKYLKSLEKKNLRQFFKSEGWTKK